MKDTKVQKGITLIALIITIVVLLILAAVAIKAVQGDGIISKAKEASKQSKIASEKEIIDLSYKNAQSKNLGGKVSISDLRKSLSENEETDVNILKSSAEGDMKITLKSGNRYLVDKNGNVTYLVETDEDENIELTDVYVYLGDCVEDGTKTLIFSNQNQDTIDGYTNISLYGNIKDSAFEVPSDIPWYDDRSVIVSVDIVNEVVPTYCSALFVNLINLIKIKNLNNLNTSQTITMSRMFYNCSNLNSLDVSSFNTEHVTDMTRMFYKCSGLTSLDISSFNTKNVTTMEFMFSKCSNLSNLDLSSFNTENVRTMKAMFCDCYNLSSLDVSSLNTEHVTDMTSMFSGVEKAMALKEIKGLENFDTSSVTKMTAMFQLCSNLTNINLSNFDTSKVTDMAFVFAGCANLSSLDLSSFNTSSVTTMQQMFFNCTDLKDIKADPSKWVMAANITDMFAGCGVSSLTYINS